MVVTVAVRYRSAIVNASVLLLFCGFLVLSMGGEPDPYGHVRATILVAPLYIIPYRLYTRHL